MVFCYLRCDLLDLVIRELAAICSSTEKQNAGAVMKK